MKKKDNTVRMDWDTYAYLRSLLEDQQNKLEREYQSALNYIPSEVPKGDKPTSRDKAHRIFSDTHAKLTAMKEQLRAAAASTYKDHPSKAMREFWGLKD